MFLGNFPKSSEQLFSIFQNSRNAGTFLGPSQASLNGLFAKIADPFYGTGLFREPQGVPKETSGMKCVNG